MRLLAGLLAAAPFESVLRGDASLTTRPMERVADPLRAMGADVRTTDGHAPIVVRGVTANVADLTATTRSHVIASSQAPPHTPPSTAAITGKGAALTS